MGDIGEEEYKNLFKQYKDNIKKLKENKDENEIKKIKDESKIIFENIIKTQIWNNDLPAHDPIEFILNFLDKNKFLTNINYKIIERFYIPFSEYFEYDLLSIKFAKQLNNAYIYLMHITENDYLNSDNDIFIREEKDAQFIHILDKHFDIKDIDSNRIYISDDMDRINKLKEESKDNFEVSIFVYGLISYNDEKKPILQLNNITDDIIYDIELFYMCEFKPKINTIKQKKRKLVHDLIKKYFEISNDLETVLDIKSQSFVSLSLGDKNEKQKKTNIIAKRIDDKINFYLIGNSINENILFYTDNEDNGVKIQSIEIKKIEDKLEISDSDGMMDLFRFIFAISLMNGDFKNRALFDALKLKDNDYLKNYFVNDSKKELLDLFFSDYGPQPEE
jgi:hypothetical protein